MSSPVIVRRLLRSSASGRDLAGRLIEDTLVPVRVAQTSRSIGRHVRLTHGRAEDDIRARAEQMIADAGPTSSSSPRGSQRSAPAR